MLVDTVRVSGPIARHDLPRRRHEERLDLVTGEVTRRDVSAFGAEVAPGVQLKVDHRHGTPHAGFELSVPTYLDGINIHAANLTLVGEAVSECYRQAQQWVEWLTPCSDLRVSRLDLVRDFEGVEDIASVLDALQGVPVSRTNCDERWRNPAQGGAESLVRGSAGRWRATLYDKAAQVRSLASRERDQYVRRALWREAEGAAGRLRFEVGVRSEVLRRRSITRMSDLRNDSVLADMRHYYFDRSGYGQEVGGMTKVEQVLRIMSSDPSHYKKADRMLGVLLLDVLGLEQAASSKTTLAEYRRLARSYGLNAADMVTTDRATVALDFETGRVRRGV